MPMHAERDIVLPILPVLPPVCLSSAGTVSKRKDISSHFSNTLAGASSFLFLFRPTAVTKLQWEIGTIMFLGGHHSPCQYLGPPVYAQMVLPTATKFDRMTLTQGG